MKPAARHQPHSSRLNPGPHNAAAGAPARPAVVALKSDPRGRPGPAACGGVASGGPLASWSLRFRAWEVAGDSRTCSQAPCVAWEEASHGARCGGSRSPWWSHVTVVVITIIQGASTRGALWRRKLWVSVPNTGTE